MIINIGNYIGLYCISYQDGLRIAELISFYEPDNIVLNFKRVEVVSMAFLNATVNSLTKKHSVDYIKSFLEFQNLPTDNDYDSIIERVLVGSYKYNNDPEYQKAVDEAVQKEME